MGTLGKKTRRRYSDREIAGALKILDTTGNLTETSRLTGIPDSTISGWDKAQRQAGNPDIPLMRAGYDVTGLANSFEEIAHLSTGEIRGRLRDKDQVKGIPLPHLLKASEVGVQSSQLLRGLPTSIAESVERQELVVILQSALEAGAVESVQPCIDITPEPRIEPQIAAPPPVPAAVSTAPAYEFRQSLVDG